VLSTLVSTYAIVFWEMASLSMLSFFLCITIIYVSQLRPRLRVAARHLSAVQATHTNPTPRLGGIAIFGALAASLAFAPNGAFVMYSQTLLAASFLFSAGLLEDMEFGISPRMRLLAACLASLVAIWMTGTWLPRSDIPGLDFLMTHWAIGVPMTVLVTAGAANSFNLIDGINGLAAMTSIIASVALGVIAHQAGFVEMAYLAAMLAACTFGFFLANYPSGRIFLGDAGAYTLGFILSWFGIFILLYAPEASPWAILLTIFWPVADTFLAISRRRRRQSATMAPDRLHMHQVVMRLLEIQVLGRGRREIANPLSTLVLAPFVIAPPIVGVLFWNQPLIAFLSVLLFGACFFGAYILIPTLLRRKKPSAPRPSVTGRLDVSGAGTNRDL
jgi:UDP-GlcNAc:undecaprenyl-phosphate GlcNAc-1-phosphate transferase